ncbi:MAG: response regulator [Gammaproteobacteria bacterium]|nr:response regulator [Gammaproteobacteria bacterium]
MLTLPFNTEDITLLNTNNSICLEEIISYMPGNVYWTDANGLYQGCNANVVKVLKLGAVSNIVGKKIHELLEDQKIADEVSKVDAEVILNDREVVVEQEAFDEDGKWAVYFTKKQPLHDADGRVVGLLGMSLDITERKLAEQAAIKAKEEAEAASRAKTEFLANMSHDVKTPMSGVISVADLMRTRSDWRTPEKAEMIYSCGMQVLNFFNSCLELSKLEMAEWSSEAEEFSLWALFEEIHTLFLPRAQSKNLKFTINYDPHLPQSLIGHRGSIYRVVLNLIGNALKFTEHGEVTLRAFLVATNQNNSIEVGITVQDTGPGIPEDKQEIIFEKLRRLTPSYEGKIEGSGIGLYIVDQYVKRMGGYIKVESQLGCGSTFTIFLPMTAHKNVALNLTSKIKTPVPPPMAASQNLDMPLVATTQEAMVLSHDAPHILLVEDSPIVQVVTKTLLNEAGFQVDIAGTGAEAIAMFSSGKYGLIYMDIGLPDMDGYAVTQAIREKEKLAETPIRAPIIALTGHGAIDVQTFCGKAGMQGVLSKPIKRAQIEGVWKCYGQGESINVEGLTIIEPL